MITCHSEILESSAKKEINYFNGIVSQLQHFPWSFSDLSNMFNHSISLSYDILQNN